MQFLIMEKFKRSLENQQAQMGRNQINNNLLFKPLSQK